MISTQLPPGRSRPVAGVAGHRAADRVTSGKYGIADLLLRSPAWPSRSCRRQLDLQRPVVIGLVSPSVYSGLVSSKGVVSSVDLVASQRLPDHVFAVL